MHVRVNEARQDKAPAPVERGRLGMRVPELGVVAACGDAPVVDEQPAVLMADEGSCVMERIGGRVKQGSSDELGAGHRNAACSARACRTAKNTRSGVAGLGKETSRIVSRTEMASINGGSPTAPAQAPHSPSAQPSFAPVSPWALMKSSM